MLERLSDPARRALELAGSEAHRLGHRYIGTEHVLLGLLAEGESGAARTLVAAGARLDGARDRVAEAVGHDAGDTGAVDGELPYTARAARALDRASRLSLQRRDEQLGTEHILLSVLDIEGTAGQVLRRLGVDIAGLRDSVDLDDGDGRLAASAPTDDGTSGPDGSPADGTSGPDGSPAGETSEPGGTAGGGSGPAGTNPGGRSGPSGGRGVGGSPGAVEPPAGSRSRAVGAGARGGAGPSGPGGPGAGPPAGPKGVRVRSGSGPVSAIAEDGSEPRRTAPPRCPDCRSSLDGALAYRMVIGRGRGDSRRFVVAYCSACGCSLGATPE